MFQGNRKLWLTLGGRLHRQSERRTMEGRRVDYLIFSITLLSLHGDATLEGPADSTVVLKENLTLACTCPWSGNLTQISWEKRTNHNKTQVAVFHHIYGKMLFGDYQQRTIFLNSSEMDGSIMIKEASAADQGFYQCSMQTFPKGTWTKKIRVIDTDVLKTHNSDLNIEIKEANNFLLKCNYNLNGTIYSVTIEKLGDGFKDNIASCSFAHRPLVGADYIERSILNCTDFLQVNLLLKNVTVDDEGLYRCHFIMKEENRTTTVSLTVIKEKDDLIKTLFIYIGAGLGFLIAVLITTVICLKRKKKKRMRKRAKHPPARRRHYNNYQQSMIHDRVSKRPNDRTHEDIYINLKNVSNPTRKKKTTFG
ncbi:CD226 antigen [Polypterus senegalus]|uniref:CD226 antigen n=1 Tax=Polypterus senegalus TaxID=55291 RepID=UPI001965D9ED|nr:CD226 antigen [Polypterus senegalus]